MGERANIKLLVRSLSLAIGRVKKGRGLEPKGLTFLLFILPLLVPFARRAAADHFDARTTKGRERDHRG